MLFFLTLLADSLAHPKFVWGSVSPIFWDPIFPFKYLGIPGAGPLFGFECIWLLALVGACLGYRTHLAAVLGTGLLATPLNFSSIHHASFIVLWALWTVTWSMGRFYGILGSRKGFL